MFVAFRWKEKANHSDNQADEDNLKDVVMESEEEQPVPVKKTCSR